MKLLPHIAALAVLMLALGLGTTACSDDSCYDNGSSLPLATFCVGDNQQTISGLTIMGIGVPGDSLLLDSASAKETYLPLRATTGSTSFLLRRHMIADTVWTHVDDTLTIDYEPIEYFHSLECGAMFNFAIKRVTCTHHVVDSVVLLTDLITNSPSPSLRIHFGK